MFVDDANGTNGLIAYVDSNGDEIELQVIDMSVSDNDPRKS